MLKVAHTICPSCSVGCGVNLIIKDQEAVGTYPYKRHPINEGKNCKKGRDSYQILNENRLRDPLLKKGGLEQVSWEDALETTVSQLKSHKNHEIGIIASGNCTNEEYETLKKFAATLGVENIGYNAKNIPAFNFETATLDDVENSDFILIIGDVLKENPLLGRRVILAKEGGAEIITADFPDKTLTGINSDEYMQIESISAFLDNINRKVLETPEQSSTVIISGLSGEEFENVLKFFQDSHAKLLPVMEECNSRGAMNILPALNENELKDLLKKVKLLYVVGDDPASYMEESLKNIEFLITQNFFINETVLMSDVVLPGSCWAEKSGSFTNTTGETQKFNQIMLPPENARDDVTILMELAEKMGLEL
ncbi:MAG: molybdopterin-dependent oxidoreductase [Methanobacterium sp.]|jgi:formate dehydrogenase major subunit|nr:molybdopterin-dependent oxidoreductase [Methanobacterium sp.]